MDFVLFWSFLLTRECIVEVTGQFCSNNERKNDRRIEFLLSPLAFLAFCLPALQWEHRWAFICPARRLLHLFACGQNGLGRGL